MNEGTPVDVAGARKVAPFAPALLQSTDHYLCSGCGHPVAWRLLVEVLDELDLVDRSIGVVGHGCYTQIITTADVEFLQCLLPVNTVFEGRQRLLIKGRNHGPCWPRIVIGKAGPCRYGGISV